MKAIIIILSLISFSALGCQTKFPKTLECRSSASIDSGLVFEFSKLDSKTVEMRVLELDVAGEKLLMTEELAIKRNRLKSEAMKVKFSKDFEKMKSFKSKTSLDRKNFNCH